jgi:hypothetical protein
MPCRRVAFRDLETILEGRHPRTHTNGIGGCA